MMVRNKALHGADPAPILDDAGVSVAAWQMGISLADSDHLGVDDLVRIHLSATLFRRELLAGVEGYEKYLRDNMERSGPKILENHLPRERFLRAAWARFTPHVKDKNKRRQAERKWMALGATLGIPT
jgi:hypothetical protein